MGATLDEIIKNNRELVAGFWNGSGGARNAPTSTSIRSSATRTVSDVTADAETFASAVGGTVRIGAVATWATVVICAIIVVALILSTGSQLLELLNDIVKKA